MKVTRVPWLLAFVLLFGACQVKSANILAFFPSPSFSHQITYQPIMRALAERGHKVTVITPDPIGDPTLTNLEEIDLHDLSYGVWDKYNISNYGAEEEIASGDITPMINAYMEIIDQQLGHQKVQSLIKDNANNKFDLLICEFPHFTCAPFQKIYHTSVVGIVSLPLHLVMAKYVGVPDHPILYPDLNLPYGRKLTTFWQKVHSFLHSTIGNWFLERMQPVFEDIFAKHYGWELALQAESLIWEVDMVMVNHNPILHNSRPIVPALIEFNGIHIKPPKKLPDNLKSFLDSASEGAVYISFGSNIKSISLPLVKREMILEVLAALPYKFLWKFEADLENLPKNVKIVKWAPQQDILRHPNVKLFITQGGLQSLDEAMYTKTPILAVPFFGDQLGNAIKAEQAGIGKRLAFASLTKQALRESILSIINDKQYKDRMEEVYDILTDQPMSAIEKTVWWIEYVLRHKGARHLRSPSVDATFMDYYMVDVIGFIFVVVAVALFLLFVISKFVITRLIMLISVFFYKCYKNNKIKKN